MKPHFLIFVILVTSIAAVAQQPSGFTFESLAARHDKNEDGVISKDEFKGNPKLFERFDTNKDGNVTKEEFDTGLKQARKQQQQRKPRTRNAPEGVTVHRDLEYAVEDGQSLKLDLYLPQTTSNTPPLMVWIHGGGWKNGDKANVNPAILRLSTEGYAVASINYRLKDLTIHPKNIHDCKGAVRWLRAHAEEYGFDPARVGVGGGSAGGHLALLLGLSSGFQELEGTVGGNTNQSSAVSAIVDLYGPSELMVFSQTDARFNNAHEFFADQLKHASPSPTFLKTIRRFLFSREIRTKQYPWNKVSWSMSAIRKWASNRTCIFSKEPDMAAWSSATKRATSKSKPFSISICA